MLGVASAGGRSARRCRQIWAAAVFALLLAALPAAAQDYPTHPITLIVPFPAGGGVDAVARIVAAETVASRSASRSSSTIAAAPAA